MRAVMRMTHMFLPTHVDPRKLALQGCFLEGEVNLEHLTRLSSSVSSVCSPFKVMVRFSIDESKAKIACGVATVSVMTICQRCLDEVQVDLNAKFDLQIVYSEEQAQQVARNYEPWLVADRMANLCEVLEDEILLALPVVNYHPVGSCTGDAFISEVDPSDGSAGENPFSILKQLKRS